MRSKKGQVVFYTLMLGVLVIVLALALAGPTRQITDGARNASTETSVGLDCNNATISDYDKATCVTTDLTLPYFILGLVGVAGLIIGARLVFGGSDE